MYLISLTAETSHAEMSGLQVLLPVVEPPPLLAHHGEAQNNMLMSVTALTSQSEMAPYTTRAAASSLHQRSTAACRAGLPSNVPGGGVKGEGGGGSGEGGGDGCTRGQIGGGDGGGGGGDGYTRGQIGGGDGDSVQIPHAFLHFERTLRFLWHFFFLFSHLASNHLFLHIPPPLAPPRSGDAEES